MDMTPEKAKELMAEAIKAMLDCGQFKAAHTAAMRTQVKGQYVNVTCVFFGESVAALEAIADRAATPAMTDVAA